MVSVGAVASARVEHVTQDSGRVVWSGAEGAVGYLVEVRREPLEGVAAGEAEGLEWEPCTEVGAQCFALVDGLESGCAYRFRVRGKGAVGGCVGSVGAMTDPCTPLGAPENVAVVSVTNSSAVVSWDPVPNAAFYRIECSEGGSGAESRVVAERVEATGSHEVVGLNPGVDQVVLVRAGFGHSFALDAGEVVARPLGTPTNLAVGSIVGSEWVEVTWGVAKGTTQHRIRWWPLGGSPEGESQHVDVAQGETSTAKFRCEGLRTGQPVMVSVNSGSGGVFESVGTTVTGTPLGAPNEVAVVSVDAACVFLSWDPVPGAKFYRVTTTRISTGDTRLVSERVLANRRDLLLLLWRSRTLLPPLGCCDRRRPRLLCERRIRRCVCNPPRPIPAPLRGLISACD